MADVVLNFVVTKLLQIIQENWEMIGGANEDSSQLKNELNRLNAFLKDAAKYRQSNSEQWKYFVNEVQVMVYKAEGIMDKLLVEVKLHTDKNAFKRFFDAKYALAVRELTKNIKDVIPKVRRIREENPKAFEANPKRDDQPGIQPPVPQDTLLEENEIVGFDEEANTVIQRLADERSTDLDVIPVVGLPGLGKTTLAIKIFKDPRISFDFFYKIWAYVGPKYKPKEVFLSILGGLMKITEELQRMAPNELINKISESISKGGKGLIVLDDVWHPEVVHSVMNVFPKNNKGHRIMITTRHHNIGRYASPDPHMLKFLNENESFQLLEKRVFIGSNSKTCPEELAGHGKNIAKQCQGVPLAVVVIAGALKGQTSKDYWEVVNANVGKHLIDKDKPESCLKYVEISYYQLPEDMKACFLYCGAFPQGFEIPAWKLIRLWISEGLMNSNLDGKPEDLAEIYLNELVNRNLMIVTKRSADGRVKTCRIHDMLHQFCKMEAKSGGLFQEVCEKSDQTGLSVPNLDTCRRLSIQLPLLKDFISTGPSSEQVRSFLCFSARRNGSEQLTNIQLLHKAFPLVRVLDVESLKFRFSKDFKEFYHLRYIAISGDYESLPVFFGKFWNLQTLILNTEKPSIEIKADIWKMLQLRHLHTNVPATLPSPATKTADEKPSCLQTLSKVAPGSCKEDVFARACKLRKVSIEGQMAEFFETKKGGFNNFKKLKCLEQLKLLNDNIGNSISKVLQLPPIFLGFINKLRILTLSNTRFAWSDANQLGQLECLEVLKLKENAFIGTTWDSQGFSQLKVLHIQRAEFETWNASERSFRGLKCLVLISCDKLEAVPSEFAGVSSLQEMTLENSKKAINSAKAIKDEKEKKSEHKGKAAETKSGTVSQAFKFKLTIFPPEAADCSATP